MQLTLASLLPVHVPHHELVHDQLWVWVEIMLPNKKQLRLTNLVKDNRMQRMIAILDYTILEKR